MQIELIPQKIKLERGITWRKENSVNKSHHDDIYEAEAKKTMYEFKHRRAGKKRSAVYCGILCAHSFAMLFSVVV